MDAPKHPVATLRDMKRPGRVLAAAEGQPVEIRNADGTVGWMVPAAFAEGCETMDELIARLRATVGKAGQGG